MATVASPYGLRPVNLIGGQYNSGGGIREFALTTNRAYGIFTGDIIVLDSSGLPARPTGASPVGGTTAGVIGVCAGVRYVDPNLKYTIHSQFLPTGAITAGATEVYIKVYDDPDQLYQVQADGAVATTDVGANAPIAAFASEGSTTTGLSATVLDQSLINTTGTLALRIVSVLDPGAAYSDCIVKFNFGVHSYYFATGV